MSKYCVSSMNPLSKCYRERSSLSDPKVDDMIRSDPTWCGRDKDVLIK